jgi:hypothetical protein
MKPPGAKLNRETAASVSAILYVLLSSVKPHQNAKPGIKIPAFAGITN